MSTASHGGELLGMGEPFAGLDPLPRLPAAVNGTDLRLDAVLAELRGLRQDLRDRPWPPDLRTLADTPLREPAQPEARSPGQQPPPPRQPDQQHQHNRRGRGR